MASLQKEPTGAFHIVIRIDGKRYKRSLRTKNETIARAKKDEIQETLELVRRGRLSVPENATTVDFVLNPEATRSETVVKDQAKNGISLKKLFEEFFRSLPDGSLEDCSIDSMRTHQKHFLRILGARLPVKDITGQTLQTYINARAKEFTHFLVDRSTRDSVKNPKRKLVTGVTIRKELVTLGTVWRWALTVPLVSGVFPNRGLRHPKSDERPPFQTWTEIERQIDQGEMDISDADLLWACLYLRRKEIDELLAYVKENANHEFIYPMVVMAAYTGARRSELLRSRTTDFDFESGILTIRERKRVRSRRSTRRVPMNETLKSVMTEWFEGKHPGGRFAFAQLSSAKVSKPNPITRDQAHCHFQQTLGDSRWECIKGWHCLRHSFISNLACAGIDQRIIDDFVGHTTDEMRRRYRHLFPEVKQAAINQVFG